MGLRLWACSVWRWGAFDGPSPSRNAGRVCMVTGDLHTRSSNTSVEHAPRETRGTMQLTDGRDRLNACNYDWPRKGPIAIVRSAARRGADRTARARCVCYTTNSVFSILQSTVQQPDRAPPKDLARAMNPAAPEDAPHRRRVAAPRAQARSAAVRKVCLFFLVVASLVSLDASGPRRARARYSPSQPHTRRRDTAARSRRQRGPAAPLTRDTANGLALVGLFYWRWGAFDGPPPSKNAGSLR